jgi:hypothetical protein
MVGHGEIEAEQLQDRGDQALCRALRGMEHSTQGKRVAIARSE